MPNGVYVHQRSLVETRFWQKVDKSGPLWNGTPCWIWMAYTRPDGYGEFRLGWPGFGLIRAHRYAYELTKGPIPVDLQTDHLCRVRNCVNPDHLEPVTHVVNVQRGIAGLLAGARQRNKTHCRRGHPFDGTNTYLTPNGRRNCRACIRISTNLWHERAKEVRFA